MEFKRIFAASAGRDSEDIRNVFCMLSFQGQVPQEFHQDSSYTKLAAVLFVTEGIGTEFLQYDGGGKHLLSLRWPRRIHFLSKQWELTRDVNDKIKVTGGEKQSPGSVIFFNSGHIHRQPAPLRKPSFARRTVFTFFHCGLSLHHTDEVRLLWENWAEEWAATWRAADAEKANAWLASYRTRRPKDTPQKLGKRLYSLVQ